MLFSEAGRNGVCRVACVARVVPDGQPPGSAVGRLVQPPPAPVSHPEPEGLGVARALALPQDVLAMYSLQGGEDVRQTTARAHTRSPQIPGAGRCGQLGCAHLLCGGHARPGLVLGVPGIGHAGRCRGGPMGCGFGGGHAAALRLRLRFAVRRLESIGRGQGRRARARVRQAGGPGRFLQGAGFHHAGSADLRRRRRKAGSVPWAVPAAAVLRGAGAPYPVRVVPVHRRAGSRGAAGVRAAYPHCHRGDHESGAPRDGRLLGFLH